MKATRTAADVRPGEKLPELAIPLTRTLIVATAIASRDYQDVHHDPGLAVERGSKDVFMNILTTNGLVDRFVTAWAGPGAAVKRIKIRLGAPNYPGDTMTLTGEVAGVDGDRVEVAVRGENGLGAHVTGTVVVALPVVSTEPVVEPVETTRSGEGVVSTSSTTRRGSTARTEPVVSTSSTTRPGGGAA